jgi:TrmH family RNA methyltransferase
VQLTSIQNPRLQELRKAARAGRPLPEGLVVAEGPHLLEEASASCWNVQEIFATETALARFSSLLSRSSATITGISERVLHSLATTETSQGLIMLLRPRVWSWSDLISEFSLIVALDAIQDPGNIGMILRSAEGFSATGIVLLNGCARIANGKLLRAAAGSLFRIPFLEDVPIGEFLTRLEMNRVPLYALAANGEIALADADLHNACAFAVGNEGRGVSPQILDAAKTISIPTRVQSLNAGVACSIALFEAARQRTSL